MLNKLIKGSCLLFILFFSVPGIAQLQIIPKPVTIVQPAIADSFTLSAQTNIITDNAALQPTVNFLNLYLKQVYGFALKTGKKAASNNVIRLKLEKENTTTGAYTLNVAKDKVEISSGNESGIFYGMQSLLQLLPVEKSVSLNIPLVRIEDAPRYQYRGMMLDVGRHFFPASFVKKYIDYLALHKMNYLHWHLTEDQGWRIEIKKHPELTRKGAWRNGTIIGNYPGSGNDNLKYGGYYTQKEIKEIVQYAADRYITVVPEIEMPGHASAAIAAFPNLSCFPSEPTNLLKHPSQVSMREGGKQVQETWGVHDDVFCAGNDSVFTLLQDVLEEVITLFPSAFIHIGGDESPKKNWERCARCQRRIKENGLKDEHHLQSYFIQRIEKYINSKGRKLIGWDEILEGGLAPNAVVMSWRGEAGGIEAAKQRHDVIMTPNSHLYFDHFQGHSSLEPIAIGGYLPLERVYSYNPTPAVLTADEAKHVLGVQANLWTEYIETEDKVEYMTMPRLAALSEVAWTQPENKNWNDFKNRMEQQYKRYDLLGINYAKSAYNVRQTVVIENTPGKATVTFSTDTNAPQIFYTIDGAEPSTNSKLYEKPFDVWKTATIKAAVFKDGKPLGKTSVQHVVIN